MAHKVEQMAYTKSGGVPWHGLGNAVSDKMTPKQMMKASGTDWTVSKREVFLKEGIKVPSQYALCRDTDDKFLSMVGETYKPIQNEEGFEFLRRWTEAGHMMLDTAGSLDFGRYVWALAKIDKKFKLPGRGGDEVEGYLLICMPHIRGKAMIFQTTAVRVVCWNTLTFAIGKDLRGKGKNAFRVPHSTAFTDTVKEQAMVALGLATEQMVQFQEAATILSKKKAKPTDVEEYFCEVLNFNPKEAEKKKDGEPREPKALPKFRVALTHAPGHNLASAAGTWWGALNAVTYVCDHENSKEKQTALKNAWLGHQATIKRKALDLALQKAA